MIPHVTESYNCTNDATESEPPFCVLKSFPSSFDQAAMWAANKVETLIGAKPKAYNEFFLSGSKEEICQKLSNGMSKEKNLQSPCTQIIEYAVIEVSANFHPSFKDFFN